MPPKSWPGAVLWNCRDRNDNQQSTLLQQQVRPIQRQRLSLLCVHVPAGYHTRMVHGVGERGGLQASRVRKVLSKLLAQPFITTIRTGKPSAQMQWRDVTANFVIANYGGSKEVDNDDGSLFWKVGKIIGHDACPRLHRKVTKGHEMLNRFTVITCNTVGCRSSSVAA